MEFSDKELQTIEELASLFFSLKDIAIVLEKDPDEFAALINLEEGLPYSMYKKGWIASEIEIRKSLLESATNGSSPAQEMILEINKNNKNA